MLLVENLSETPQFHHTEQCSLFVGPRTRKNYATPFFLFLFFACARNFHTNQMIEKLFQISPETSLLYSRVRSERNQSSAGGGESGGGGGSSAGGRSNNGQSSAGGGGSSGGAGNPSGSGGVAGSASSDRDSFSRWRDRQYYGPRRWFQRDDSAWDKEAAGNKNHKKKKYFTKYKFKFSIPPV